MNLPLVYLPGARDDLDAAFTYYEQQSAGLGYRFISSIHEHVSRIQSSPEIHGIIHSQVRASLLKRFPYVVYYRIEEHRIVVVAVQHGRRDWLNWTSRA